MFRSSTILRDGAGLKLHYNIFCPYRLCLESGVCVVFCAEWD
jgi:hypothetical protein